jgi:zinc protease
MGIENLYELNLELMPTITLEEVNAAAPDFFVEESRVLVVTQPEKEGVVASDDALLRNAFAAVAALEIEPYVDEVNAAQLVPDPPRGGTVVEKLFDEDLQLHTWTLSNGVRVLLRPSSFKEDEILLSAYSPGGTSLSDDEDAISARLAGSIVPAMGLGGFSPPQLQKKLAGKQVSMRPYISELEEGFSGSSTPEDFPTLLELIYLSFTEPRRDEEVFGALMQRYAAMLANRAASPEQAFSDSLGSILTQYHPRARPLTVERLSEVELDTAFDFYVDRFADASDFSFVLVGNFVPDEIEALVARWLGGLPSTTRVEGWRDLGIRPPSGVVTQVVHRGGEPKARTSIVFSGDFVWNRDQRHAISSLAQILEIRLRERLREDLSGTYGVSVGASRQPYPWPSYNLQIGFGCDPLRLQELSDEVFAAVAEMKVDGPTADELAKVKEQQRRQFEEGMLQNGAWMSMIAFRDRYEIPQRELLSTLEQIDALDADRVQAAAIRYLDLYRYVQVSLLPE